MQIEYKNIDAKLVVNEIRNGRSLESVQKVFGLRFKSEVQDLYLKGLMELGEIPQVEFNRSTQTPSAIQDSQSQDRAVFVKRQRQRPPVPEPSVVVKTGSFRTIGQSGSITLNKALLIEALGFRVGDTFEIYREDDRLVLKKAPDPLSGQRGQGLSKYGAGAL